MTWFPLSVQFLCIFSLGFGQDVPTLKLDQIGELLMIVRSLDTQFHVLDDKLTTIDDRLIAMNARQTAIDDRLIAMDDRQTAIDDRLIAMEDRLTSIEGQTKESSQDPSNLDLLYQTFADIFKGERELMKNLSSETCSRNQLETLQELLATDECEDGSGLNNCSPDAQCRDARIGYKCTCVSGYQGNGITCEDVDECGTGVHTCSIHGLCQNHLGNYSCICRQGFSGDGFKCEDIDECSTGSDTCSSDAVCSNTEGDYDCQCLSGFTGDGFTCQDIDECNTGVSPCNSNADCKNNQGSFDCNCRSGFTGDGISCEELDLSCVAPSQQIGSLGCVTPVTDEGRSWEQAQEYCRTLGGRLLEGITSQDILNLIKQHFKIFNDGNFVWAGFRQVDSDLEWTEEGGVVDPTSPLWGGSSKPTGCGSICVSCLQPDLASLPCNSKRFALCQS